MDAHALRELMVEAAAEARSQIRWAFQARYGAFYKCSGCGGYLGRYAPFVEPTHRCCGTARPTHYAPPPDPRPPMVLLGPLQAQQMGREIRALTDQLHEKAVMLACSGCDGTGRKPIRRVDTEAKDGFERCWECTGNGTSRSQLMNLQIAHRRLQHQMHEYRDQIMKLERQIEHLKEADSRRPQYVRSSDLHPPRHQDEPRVFRAERDRDLYDQPTSKGRGKPGT